MAKAYYTTDNIGHYGLAFPNYTHQFFAHPPPLPT